MAMLLTDEYTTIEVLWTFSEFLEGFAMVPQYASSLFAALVCNFFTILASLQAGKIPDGKRKRQRILVSTVVNMHQQTDLVKW